MRLTDNNRENKLSRSWSIRRRELVAHFIEQDLTQRSVQRLLAVTAHAWALPGAAFALAVPRSGAGAQGARPLGVQGL